MPGAEYFVNKKAFISVTVLEAKRLGLLYCPVFGEDSLWMAS
jgi:hypothetical protein